MKKITAIILIACCAFALFSCGAERQAIDRINEMFEANSPTGVVIETSQIIRNEDGEDVITLNGVVTLVTGKYNGKDASVYESKIDRFATVEEGATEDKGTYIIPGEKNVKKMEYLEEKGVRIDGGKWDADADDFAPTAGAINLNLKKRNLTDPVYENGKLSFTVAADKTAEVLGEAYARATDVKVEITEYEGFVTSILIEYDDVPENEDYPSEHVIIKATYSYGIQTVNID